MLFTAYKYSVNQSQHKLTQLYDKFGKDFCLCPFVGAFYQTNGGDANSVRPCSLVPDREEYKITHSIQQTRNNQHWRNIRQQFLSGTANTVPDCEVCHAAERQGAAPARLGANQHMAQHTDLDLVAAIEQIQSQDLVSHTVAALDYYPSNYCNYSCVMCSGGASSSRRTFEIRLGRSQDSVPVRGADPDFLDLLNTAEIVNFTGGETVLQPEVHAAIDHLISSGRAGDVTVFILTNASSYKEKFISQLAQFRNVIFMCSIDGVGPVLEYQRRGAQWPTVEQNILKFLHTANLSLVMNAVLTAVNLLNIHELVNWAEQHKLAPGQLAVTPVFGVDALSVAAVPEQLRDLARARLAQCAPSELVNRILQILDHTPHQPDLVDHLVEHIYYEDTASAVKFTDVVPEWKEYFDNSAFRPTAV